MSYSSITCVVPVFLAAIAACICGVLLVLKRTGGVSRAAALVCIACGGALLLMQAVSMIEYVRTQDANMQCGRNLSMVREALLLFFKDHGQLPTSLDSLTDNGYLFSHELAPSAGKTQYVFGPEGNAVMGEWSNPARVIVYESLANHDGRGIHVLLGSGDIIWLDEHAAKAFIRAIENGKHGRGDMFQLWLKAKR